MELARDIDILTDLFLFVKETKNARGMGKGGYSNNTNNR